MPTPVNLTVEDLLDLSALPRPLIDANDEMILIGIFGAKAAAECPVVDCEYKTEWCNPAVLCGLTSGTGNISAGAPK